MKKSVFQLMMLVVLHAHAMVKQDSAMPCDDVCYLNQMPLDILNHIAGFLMESEEDFVVRTLAEKRKRDAEWNKNAHYEVVMPNMRLISRYKDKTIFVSGARQRLGLNDCGKIYEYKQLAASDYQCCALAPNGTIIAIFHRQFLPEKKYRTPILEIIKVRTENVPEQKNGNLIVEERRELLKGRGKGCNFVEVAFNQQGQKLIAWKLSSTNTTDKSNYKIFTLPLDWLPVNQLQAYLRDKCVCDKYIEGKK